MYISPSEISASDSLLRVENTSISIPLQDSKDRVKLYVFKKSRSSTQGLCALRPTGG